MNRTRKEQEAYYKRCRAPFTDGHGNSTLLKHPKYVDASYLRQLADITSEVPEAHKQGFIRLHRLIFGVKILKPDNEK